MQKLFVDTNIILDLFLQRDPFYKSAEKLFSLTESKNIKVYISSLTIANAYYVVSKIKTRDIAREAIFTLKVLTSLVPLENKIVDLALNNVKFNDFEDALQYYSAINVNCDFIITRDLKDFKYANIPVMTATSFLKTLKQ